MIQTKTVKYDEVCPHCEAEGVYDEIPVVKCPSCGKRILACNMCKQEKCYGCTVDSPNFDRHPDVPEFSDINIDEESRGHICFNDDKEYLWNMEENQVMVAERKDPIDKASGSRFPVLHFCDVEEFKCMCASRHKLEEGFKTFEVYGMAGQLERRFMCAECDEERCEGKTEEQIRVLDAELQFSAEIDDDLYFIMDCVAGGHHDKVLVAHCVEDKSFEINVNGRSMLVHSDFIDKMIDLKQQADQTRDKHG